MATGTDKTYRRIAGSWLRGQPHVFSRNNEQYRADWYARIEVMSGITVQELPTWTIEKRHRTGWSTVHRQISQNLNRAAIEAAEYIDLI